MTVQSAYDNLERIITYGFMSVRVQWGDSWLLLKNITDKEYTSSEMLRDTADPTQEFMYLLAYCTVFIGNHNILVDRSEKLGDLLSFYHRMPTVFLNKLKDTIQKINTEYIDSLKFLEGFCYTDRSRYLWRVLGVGSRSLYMGIPGLDGVGTNSVQENWFIVNRRLDEEDVYEKDFNLSTLVASSMNAKGTKSITRVYEARKKELEELREDIAKYGYDKKRVEEQKKKAEWTAPVKSREDLVRELYKQMRGEKDRHDLFIESWMTAQKEKAEEAKRSAEAHQKEFRESLKEVDLSDMEGSRPVSSEELRRVLERQRKKVEVSGETQSYISAFETYDQKDRFLKKISSTVIRPTASNKR